MTATLDRLPEAGDEVPIDGGRLRVERADDSVATRIQFVPEETS